jgi:MHS family alpha-ketoglutarate permease-like MFS transporter
MSPGPAPDLPAPAAPATVHHPGPAGATARLAARALAGSVPNLVQWFNLYAFATFAPYFRGEFFDRDDPGSLVAVYAVFAASFVMRPVGSWWFGRVADRRGRRRALTSSVVLMAAGSIVLALTPTREVIGAGAVVLLIAVTLIQGIATGGEYGVSAVYLSEGGAAGRRGFFSAFQSVTIVGGLVLAQLVLLILLTISDHAAVAAWGWRVAFALGGVGALAALWALRRRVPDAPPSVTRESGSLRILFTQHRRALAWVFLMTAGGTLAFYTMTVTAPTVLRQTFATLDPHGERWATVVVVAALVVFILLQPLGGALSDRVGRRPLLVFFGVAGVLGGGAFVLVLPEVTSRVAAFGILVAAGIVLTGYMSVNTVAKAEAFPASVRALGVGLGYAAANSVFGGTAPMIYHATAAGGHDDWFAIYVTAAIALSLVVYLFFTPDRRATLDPPPAATSPRG